MQCPTCGLVFRREDLVSVMGDLETWRCHACGRETWATVSRVLPQCRDDRQVRAFVRWAGDAPTARELVALRAVVPAFRDKGLSEVRDAVRGIRRWDLGEVPRQYATHELSELVRRHGLSLELVEGPA